MRAVAVAIALLGVAAAQPAHGAQQRPNVIVVMTDDQRVWDMEAMPLTNRLLGEAGTTFENAFATYPLCCPSRSTFLSGQYEHNHGVIDNDAPEGGYGKFDFSNALGVWLQAAGYRTAHVGKQLNEYGALTAPAPAATSRRATTTGSLLRDPTTYSMYNYVVQDNGIRRPYGVLPADYQTDVLADRAVAGHPQVGARRPARSSSTSRRAPLHWELYDARPARARRRGTRARSRTSRSTRARTTTRRTSPTSRASSATTRGSTPSSSRRSRTTHRTRLAALQAVDEGVARIVARARAGRRARPDGDRLHLRQRLPARRAPLPEREGRPLRGVRCACRCSIRGPGFPAGATRRQLVGNIDLAPTIVELAGATAGRAMDGESLLPLRAGRRDHRRDALARARGGLRTRSPGTLAVVIPEYHRGVNVFYDAIRTGRYKYVHWFRDVERQPGRRGGALRPRGGPVRAREPAREPAPRGAEGARSRASSRPSRTAAARTAGAASPSRRRRAWRGRCALRRGALGSAAAGVRARGAARPGGQPAADRHAGVALLRPSARDRLRGAVRARPRPAAGHDRAHAWGAPCGARDVRGPATACLPRRAAGRGGGPDRGTAQLTGLRGEAREGPFRGAGRRRAAPGRAGAGAAPAAGRPLSRASSR